MSLEAILDVIETTCIVHRLNIDPLKQRFIAMNCWVTCGGDQSKAIDYLQSALRSYENR